MNITEQLTHPSKSFLIVEKREGSDIVIGAPHHAPAGVDTLPCGRDADENTGYLAYYLSEKLRATCVIAVNGKVDPNKSPGTNYSKAIRARCPGLLVEIHGHGGKRARADVEVSAGSRKKEHHAKRLVNSLREYLLRNDNINDLSVSGTWDFIYFKASRTATITGNDWLGLHIELPPLLRLQGGTKQPPVEGYLFCEALAKALEEFWYIR